MPGIWLINDETEIVYAKVSGRTYLEAKPKEYDPMKLQKAVHADIVKMAKGFMETFGSAGRA